MIRLLSSKSVLLTAILPIIILGTVFGQEEIAEYDPCEQAMKDIESNTWRTVQSLQKLYPDVQDRLAYMECLWTYQKFIGADQSLLPSRKNQIAELVVLLAILFVLITSSYDFF